MQVVRLSIENFRGVKKAVLDFDGHTLLIGSNNVGKSTICEALDLVLGTDRLKRAPPVNEFDFYNANYLSEDGENSIPLFIEVILIDLTENIERLCKANLEYWSIKEKRLLQSGEIERVDASDIKNCLRLMTVAWYDIEEDQFVARTVYGQERSNLELDEQTKSIPSLVKRSIGFLYLRTIRTGNRALSLERGSLLDIIMRMQDVRKSMWENIRKRLATLDPSIDAEATELGPILEEIEERLSEYIATEGESRSTRLFVSQLTREHLRKTMAFFLTMGKGEVAVPFQQAGTGTLNILVLALLTFIADLKKDNVIFAMEEPEIALPPHTQRRIANYLKSETSQCFVTSHSPYVIECFEPEHIVKLTRNIQNELDGIAIQLPESMKIKTYKSNFRRGLAEAILSRGVIIGEGITEQDALQAVAYKMEAENSSLFPLDVAGVCIINADGDGNLEKLGTFFKEIGIPAFAFFDRKKRSKEEIEKLNGIYEFACEIPQKGAEVLLAEETPLNRQWIFLEGVKDENSDYGIPSACPDDIALKAHTVKVLKGLKGAGGAARLLEICDVPELPKTIVSFLNNVYQRYPKPIKKETTSENGLDLV